MEGLSRELRDLRFEFWLDNTLFTFSWWVMLLTTIGVFIVWIIVLDKKRIVEIILYGLMVMMTGTMLDVVGIALSLWQYPHTLIPLPTFTVVHIIQMPIIYMLVYQRFTKWKSFLIANTINAIIFAFILEPILVWLGTYDPDFWNHIYSVLPYIFIAAVYKWIIDNFKKTDQNYSN